MNRPRPLDTAAVERSLDVLRAAWPDATLALVESAEAPSPSAIAIDSAGDRRWWLDARFADDPGADGPTLVGWAMLAFLLVGGAAWRLTAPEDAPVADPDELARLRDEIARLQETSREWIANAAHDLRTPLAILRGSLETLALPADRLAPEQRRHYLESALEQSDRLGRLVQDLFDLTRFEGQSRIRAERFHLGELVHDCVQLTHRVFDPAGRFTPVTFYVAGSEVLDAGTEVNDEIPANVAGLAQAAPDTGVNENGLIGPHPGFLDGGNILAARSDADFMRPGYRILKVTIEAVPTRDVRFEGNGDQEVPPVDTDATAACIASYQGITDRAIVDPSPGLGTGQPHLDEAVLVLGAGALDPDHPAR